MKALQLIRILWTSFLVACVAEAVFFTAFDPQELVFLGEPVMLSRMAVYSIGFFAFWAVTVAASALTSFFQMSADQINQPPPVSGEQPARHPQREERGD